MSVSSIALFLFISFLVVIALGTPIAFAMGGISIIFGLLFWDGLPSIDAFSLGAFGKVTGFTLTAVPLYILMAAILQYSNLAEDMYEAVYRWLGKVKGGLLMGTTVISSIFAAMVGITAVATATLGMTARPSMLSRGYDDKLISGTIIVGGTLGILIPPSVLMIVYAEEAQVSAGKMFMGGILPGILAAIIFIIYIAIRSAINPQIAPKIEEGEEFTWKEKFQSLGSVILPIMVIVLVLGSIYTGIATPTEAAGIGVFGALICAIVKKQLTISNLKKIFEMTVNVNGMVLWLLIGAEAFSRVVSVTGIGSWFSSIIVDSNLSPLLTIVGIMLIIFILGMFIDPSGIILITSPLFLPIIIQLGYDPVWYGVFFIINMCIAFMTPPFGVSLFIMKGVAPDLKMETIYASIWPFVGLYLIVIILVMIFPQLILWLPNLTLG